jgi:cholesterol transport system auxiliary component
MDWHKRANILLLSLTLLLGGCVNLKQPSRKIDYYTLEYATPQMLRPAPLSIVFKMERFAVAPTYNTSRIIFRDKSFKRNAYVYHQWRANPGDLVTHFLGRDMRQSGLFKAVLSKSGRAPSSYVLDGSVDEFFECDVDEKWMAVLSLGITLMAENEPDISKRILFQRTYGTKEACKRKNPQALAEAMSRAMAKLSTEIIEDIYDHLKDTPPQDPR